MHGEITIAEPEPCFAAQAAERLHKIPGLIRPAPAALDIAETAECIQNSIDVRRDMEAEMLEIVAGVDDHCQIGADKTLQSQRQLGAAYAAA